jgi:hypothetical protein
VGGEAIYVIAAISDDETLWRSEWIGGVRYNTSVPNDPLIAISLAQLARRRGEFSAECAVVSAKGFDTVLTQTRPASCRFD